MNNNHIRHVARLFSVILLLTGSLAAQSDRGTLTGTIMDPGGAVIPGAAITLTNPETGVVNRTESTATGAYAIPSVPAGTYELSVESEGFNRHVQPGIRLQVAQTARVDVTLQIGSVSESVTVTSAAPLLKTEDAAQSTTLQREQLNELPLNFSMGAGAIRNPLSFVQLSPGTMMNGWNNIRVNGMPSGTFKIIFEGMDTTSTLDARVSDESQPSMEALEEFTLQSSNYSAEFGQVGGGLFNFTSRSGTNELHGSVYEYYANDAFNAGIPFTDNGEGGHAKEEVSRHDFGGTIGGPIYIPKVYDGRNKTFFFFNYEQFRDVAVRNKGIGTVPTDAYRAGDFTGALTGRNLGTDGLGRPILENTIYDPFGEYESGGRTYRDPFPGNVIPQSMMDPVALKIQALIPNAQTGGLVNNYERLADYRKIQQIPSIKVDHNINEAQKLSFYYSAMLTDKDVGEDGIPDPISQRRDLFIRSHTTRLNYDHTLAPTLLLHVGLGYQRYRNPDSSPPEITSFDGLAELGLKGQFDTGFPRIQSLSSGQGGMGNEMGIRNYNLYVQDKPTAVGSVTKITGNHTLKFGGEYKLDTFTNRNKNGVPGTFVFNAQQTGLPATQGQNLQGGSIGFPYASFLLGQIHTASVGNPQDPQYRRYTVGLFVQDTWKVTRRLTLDVGLRYDYQPAPWELHERTSMFAPTVANPSANGLPGAMLYAGKGPGRCDCDLTDTYPFAFGPRVGVAYQLDDKTVLRGGFAVSYGQVSQFRYIGGGNSLGMGFNSMSFTSPAFGQPGATLRDGLIYDVNELTAASYDPGLRPSKGQTNSPPALIDRNGGRPPRVFNWNIGLQRELTRDLVVEAAYVGNRGAWFRADGMNQFNALDTDLLAMMGFDTTDPADRALLTSKITSPQVAAAGFGKPYPEFPSGATLAQALRPFPQFGNLSSLWAPLGNSWYDSLQVKVTKRYSMGLTLNAAYTWSKSLATVEDMTGATTPANNVRNREIMKSLSKEDQPHVFVMAFNYDTPTINRNGFTKWVLSDWTVGGMIRYASAFPIRVPQGQNQIASLVFQGTNANRENNQSPYLVDLNSKEFDPNKDFVLNPSAWSDPAPGTWGTAAAYYGNYRGFRYPDEQFNLGKRIKIRERMAVHIRFELFNAFNRAHLRAPDSANALATQRKDANGKVISGFGRVNTGTMALPPRTGQLVLRFVF